MVNLPGVNEDFTADPSGYLSALQAMIDQTQNLVDKVSELKGLVDSLDGKTIAINVGGDANGQLDEIANKIADLDGKTVVVNVLYKNSGDAGDIAAATQAVKRVFVGSENVAPVVQPVIEQAVNSAQTSALKQQFQDVINTSAPGATATTDAMEQLAQAVADVRSKMAAENLTAGESSSVLSRLAYVTQVLGQADKEEVNSLADLENALSSVAGARQFVSAVMDEQSKSTLLAVDSTLTLARTDQILADAQAVINGDMDASGRIFGAATTAIAGQAASVGILAGWWARWGTVLHWVIAGSAEFLAVAVPGMIAMASAMMVALQAGTNVYERLVSMYTVQEALGPATNQTIGSMLGLGSSFQKAQNAMQPQLYEIYGAAIDALKGKGSELATMGEQIVNTFSTFAAKVDVELKNGFGAELQGLVSKGAQDFTEFGQILGNIGHAVVNFAAAMPGLAEVLLKVLDVLSEFLKIISEIPAPIITAAMAFEEFLRWGSLLNGMIAGLIGLFGKFAGVLGAEGVASGLSSIQDGMKGLTVAEDGAKVQTEASMTTFSGFFTRIVQFAAENPWSVIAVAIVLMASAAYVYLDKASSGMDQWIASTAKAVSSAPDFAQINTTISALSANTTQLAGAQEVLNTKTTAWSQLASGAEENVNALKNAQKDYITDITTESVNVGVLSEKLGVDMPTAIAIAQGAGVKLTDTLTGNSEAAQVNWQKIENLITGYQALGQQGNQLAADMNVVSITSSGQLSNVQKLNTAWEDFIALGTGVQSDFITFQQGLNTISTDAKTAGASFDGLNSQSLTLRNDFESNITNMTKSLGDLNTALSFGGVNWNQYRQAIATMIREMLSAGNISAAQASQLGAVASAAGYTGNSYNALAGWAQKYSGSQSQLNNIMDQATIALSNQKTMLQEIQGSMQQDVISTTAQAVLAQGGFQAALNKTYNAFKAGGDTSTAFKGDLAELDGILKSAGMNSQQINQYNEALVKSWSAASQAAQDTGTKTGALNDAFDANKVAADGLNDKIKNVFTAIGHYVEEGADTWKKYIWTPQIDALKAIVGGLATAVGDAFGAIVSFITSDIPKAMHAVESGWDSVESVTKDVWNNIKNAVTSAWGSVVSWVENLGTQFSGWWATHGTELKEIWNTSWTAIKDIATALWTATVSVVETGFNVLKGSWDSVTQVLRSAWTAFWQIVVAAAEDAWAAIGPLVTAGWEVVKNIFDVSMAFLKDAWSIFWAAVEAILKTVWDAFETITKIGWDLIVGIFSVMIDLLTGHWSRAWNDMKSMLEQVWNAMNSFLNTTWNTLKSLFSTSLNDISNFFDSVWNHVVNSTHSVWNGIMGFFKGIWTDIKNGFNGVVSGISSAWGKLQSIFQGPVNFLVHTVYDQGIARLWNDVAGVIPGVPHLPTLAEGGRLPGFGGGDILPALLEPGETVVSKEHSKALAGVFKSAGVPGYASGGIPGGGVLHNIVSAGSSVLHGIENVISNPLGVISDVASVASALLTGNTTALGNDMKKFLGNAGGAAGDLAEMIVGIPKTLVGDLMNFITGKAKANAAGTSIPGHPSGAFASWLATAMADTGVSGAAWANGLNLIALYESGYNPNAINNSDINAAQGDPSRGLMQVIMTTFDAYHQAGTSNNIYDPVANIAAAINYIKARYGSINNVPGIVSIDHGGGYVGYDTGGFLMPGLTLAYNGTGSPEMVTSPGAGSGDLHVHLNMNGKEVGKAIVPDVATLMYQKAGRNRGNANAGQYFTPGSGRQGR